MLPRYQVPGGISSHGQRRVWIPIAVPAKVLRWLPYFLAIPILLWIFLASPLSETYISGQVPWQGLGQDSGKGAPPFKYHPPDSTAEWGQRAIRVREAFVHAYSGYREQAFPSDELLPVSGGKVNK
jgi:mannosyl-oligosaccharide alpha-1,2-mannosidase